MYSGSLENPAHLTLCSRPHLRSRWHKYAKAVLTKWFSVPYKAATTKALETHIGRRCLSLTSQSLFLPMDPLPQCQDRVSQPLSGTSMYHQWDPYLVFPSAKCPKLQDSSPAVLSRATVSLFFTYICYLVGLIISKLWMTNTSWDLEIQCSRLNCGPQKMCPSPNAQ